MATQLQLRRDTAADLVSVPPAEGEPGYDQTNKRLLVGDGSRTEGIPHASFRDCHNNAFTAAVAGGTANALTLDLTDGTLDYNPTAYAKFQLFRFEAAANNTGAATLAVGGLAATAIKKIVDGAKAALDADDIVDGLLYSVQYDGSEFVLGGANLGGSLAGWALLETVSPSAASEALLTGFDHALYDQYRIVLTLEFSSTGALLDLRTSTDGGSTYDSGGTDYDYAILSGVTGGSAAVDGSNGASFLRLQPVGPSTTRPWTGAIHCFDLAAAGQRSSFTWQLGGWNASDAKATVVGSGARDADGDVDALRLFPSTGNFTGTIQLYGRRM